MVTLSIVAPVVALGAMGLFFGLLLAVSSKIFHVDQDERLPEITEDVYKRQTWASSLRKPAAT